MSYYKKGYCPSRDDRYIHIAEDDSDIYQDKETMEILSDYVILERLNEQDERIKKLEREVKNRNKLNNILEGFILDKGYDFNDILKFLQDRTEKEEGK